MLKIYFTWQIKYFTLLLMFFYHKQSEKLANNIFFNKILIYYSLFINFFKILKFKNY